jgi:hypothetical protein
MLKEIIAFTMCCCCCRLFLFVKERAQRQLEEKFEAEYKAMEAAFMEELGVGNLP